MWLSCDPGAKIERLVSEWYHCQQKRLCALVDECVALELSFGCLRHGLVDSLPNIDTGSSKKGCQAVQLLKIVGSRLRQGWITCVTEELNSYLNSILMMRNLL